MADAHAAAHDHAVHKGDVGLGVGEDDVVEGVFLGKKVFDLRTARLHRLVQKADVPTGAEVAKYALFVAAANGHGQHRRIIAPGQQLGQQAAHHAQRQGVERLGAVRK